MKFSHLEGTEHSGSGKLPGEVIQGSRVLTQTIGKKNLEHSPSGCLELSEHVYFIVFIY